MASPRFRLVIEPADLAFEAPADVPLLRAACAAGVSLPSSASGQPLVPFMSVDIASLLCALMISLVTMAVALPAVMGQVGAPARRAQYGVLLLQAAGWALLLASGAAAGLSGARCSATCSAGTARPPRTTRR